MDVLTSKTRWALNKVIIKQVASSWSLFTQLSLEIFVVLLAKYLYLFIPDQLFLMNALTRNLSRHNTPVCGIWKTWLSQLWKVSPSAHSIVNENWSTGGTESTNGHSCRLSGDSDPKSVVQVRTQIYFPICFGKVWDDLQNKHVLLLLQEQVDEGAYCLKKFVSRASV